MSENNNDLKEPLNKNFRVPKIRFPEFKDSWTWYKLQDMANRITRKNTLHESDLVLTISANQGLVPQSEYFTKNVSGIDTSGYYLLKKGDFAYNRSYSSNYPYGAIKRLDSYNSGIVSTLYIVFELKNNVISDYLAIYFETNKWHKEIANISGEGARNHGLLNLSPLDFFCTKHYIPTKNEQNKIANFINCFLSLELICSKKLYVLKKYKEGLIGALYITCPTRESYPLKYFLNEYSEKNQNNYKAVAVGKNGIRSREEIFSKEIAKDVSKNKVISKNTLIIGMGTKEIDIGILTDDIRLSVSPAYRTFNIKNIDPIYLEQILASENKLLSTRFMIQSARQGKTVDVQGFLNHKIYIHNQKAQKDISKLTMILNDLISVTNKKLDACTKVKRFLLDNMFI